MGNKRLLVMGIGAALGLGAAVWAADAPQARPGQEDRLAQELGLTQAQVGQLEQLRSQERKAAIRRRADREIARLELHDLLKAETVDEKAVRAKARQLADMEAATAVARGEAALALRKIVSAEQAQKLMGRRGRHGRGARPGIDPGAGGWRGPGPRRMGPRSDAQPGPGAQADEPEDLADAEDEL
jgi:Spy/CpxP family protein refolding chaperone